MVATIDDKINKLYDRNFKPIDFNYKEFVQNINLVNNNKQQSQEAKNDLYSKVRRYYFKEIPDGVYYFSLDGKTKYPLLLFDSSILGDILVIKEQITSDKENDEYTYYQLDNSVHGCINYYKVIAFYNDYFYGIGKTIDSARENLEKKLFNEYRNQILKMASKAKQKVK